MNPVCYVWLPEGNRSRFKGPHQIQVKVEPMVCFHDILGFQATQQMLLKILKGALLWIFGGLSAETDQEIPRNHDNWSNSPSTIQLKRWTSGFTLAAPESWMGQSTWLGNLWFPLRSETINQQTKWQMAVVQIAILLPGLRCLSSGKYLQVDVFLHLMLRYITYT